MKKIMIIVVVLVVLFIGGVVIAAKQINNTDSSMPGMSGNGMGASKKSDDANAEVDLTHQAEVSIDIKDFAYSKPNIKVKKGTKVTWTNQDTIKHNVILENTAKGAPSPEEVKSNVLAGPLLKKGERYSFTFNEVSSNGYVCSPHPYMKGTVNVVE